MLSISNTSRLLKFTARNGIGAKEAFLNGRFRALAVSQMNRQSKLQRSFSNETDSSSDAMQKQDGKRRNSFKPRFEQNNSSYYYSMNVPKTIGEYRPDWSASAVVKGKIENITAEMFDDKWLVMIFYPLDFTFVCPTELVEASDMASSFREKGAEIVAVSVDSVYSHLAWTKVPRDKGGVDNVDYPLISDLNKKISRRFGVLNLVKSTAERATFIIDPSGKIRYLSINDSSIGRNFTELLRIYEGLKYTTENGEVCPAKWKSGDIGMKPTDEGSKEWFSKNAK